MKQLLLNCLVILSITTFSQEVTRKVNNLPNGDREVYHVLKSDENVLHGKYEKMTRNARIEGSYNNGKQDGLWTEYSLTNGKFLKMEGAYKDGMKDGLWKVYSSKNKLQYFGRYDNGERVGEWKFYNSQGEILEYGKYDGGVRTGIWTFYDKRGEIEQEYDYTSKTLLSDKSLAELKDKKFKVIIGNDTAFTTLERPPVHIGGPGKIHLSQYKSYHLGKDSAKVEVSFQITSIGSTVNYKIISSTYDEVNDIALKTVQQLSSGWIPGKLNGQNVTVEYMLTVSFTRIEHKVSTTTTYTPLPNAPVDRTDPAFSGRVPGSLRTNSYSSGTMTMIRPESCLIKIL